MRINFPRQKLNFGLFFYVAAAQNVYWRCIVI